MKLYEIADEIEKVLARCVNHETGEISDEASNELDRLGMEFRDKAIHVALYQKGEELEAEAIDLEVKRLKARRDVHQRRADWLKDYLAVHLPDHQPIKDPRVVLSWRKSKRVEVVKELEVPQEFKRVKVEVDKQMVATAFREGREVPGCLWTEHEHLQIK